MVKIEAMVQPSGWTKSRPLSRALEKNIGCRPSASRSFVANSRCSGRQDGHQQRLEGDGRRLAQLDPLRDINGENLVEKVQTWLENPIFGDMLVEAEYSYYRDGANGLKFPSQIVQKRGGWPFFTAYILGAHGIQRIFNS